MITHGTDICVIMSALSLTYLGIDWDIFSPVGGPLSGHSRPMHGIAARHLGGRGVAGHRARLGEARSVAIEKSGVRQAIHIRHLAVYPCSRHTFLSQELSFNRKRHNAQNTFF
jgi:hypothetical protein